jgi:quinol monooxygenase YgiN
MSDKIVTVVATFEARPGQEVKLRAALLGLVGPTRLEAGCINYDLHESSEHAGKFLFYENWTSKSALDTHLQSPHIKALLPQVDDLCVAFPEIKLWKRIA